jgi:hypothetical protein
MIPITSMVMDNHSTLLCSKILPHVQKFIFTHTIIAAVSTTIIHQAITSKGDTKARARVIREILAIAPQAAAIKNGYGSLPLHVISQRNTKLDAPTKELLITELVHAYKGALVEQGGVGKRTPLHIIFTGMSCRQCAWSALSSIKLTLTTCFAAIRLHFSAYH